MRSVRRIKRHLKAVLYLHLFRVLLDVLSQIVHHVDNTAPFLCAFNGACECNAVAGSVDRSLAVDDRFPRAAQQGRTMPSSRPLGRGWELVGI